MRLRASLLALLVGCGSFEDPAIVLDLRILAATASIPEQVIDVDPTMELQPMVLLGQIAPIEVCYLVADPALDRTLAYTMSICPPSTDERCNTGEPEVVLATGVLADPDVAPGGVYPCTTIQPDGNLLGVLLAVLDGDPLGGLAGLDVSATLRIGGVDADRALDQYASKTVRITPRIPLARTGNKNPTLTSIEATITLPDSDTPGAPFTLPLGRCVDQVAPLEVAPDTTLRLTPIEAADARETYIVPTLDGKTSTYTESPTYQWLAGNGGWSSATTGGPKDFVGNPAPLFTDWRAPKNVVATNDPLQGPTDVPIWIIQRDERFGATWYEACIRVVP
ncbi:MAG: hypothetical protein NT062_06825 [Proteobacteria bacterium]|nr:hypothetical protein [Pseudomonadota bacterium]